MLVQLAEPASSKEPELAHTPPQRMPKRYLGGDTFQYKTEEFQFSELSMQQRNAIRNKIQAEVAKGNDLPADKVWVSLSQGSLEVNAQLPPGSANQWPQPDEMLTIIRAALVTPESPADRVRTAHLRAPSDPMASI